jgi:hypothetical protein
MNGAMADPDVKTIRNPKISRMMITGSSQNFFLTLKNAHNSFKNSTLL